MQGRAFVTSTKLHEDHEEILPVVFHPGQLRGAVARRRVGADQRHADRHDTASGTGTIYTSAASAFEGTGTAARNLANNFIFLATPTYAGTAALNLTGTVNLNGARTITVSNTALTTFSGVVSNGSVTKGGAGAVAFNSPTGNTFTGGFVNTGATATASAIYANNTSGSAFGTGGVSIGAAMTAPG